MRVLIAVIGLLALSNSALAADVFGGPTPQPPPPAYPQQPYYAPPPPPPPPYNWTSVYIGGNAGFGLAVASVTATDGFISVTDSENLTGFVGGAQIGANFQTGMLVVGIEGDFEGSTQSNTSTDGIASSTDQLVYLGTIRGRIGAAFNRVLVYSTVGFGYGEFQSTASIAGFGTVTSSQSHAALVVGSGIEVGITNNLSARIEYLFFDTGNIPLGAVGDVTLTGNIQDSIVRGGLNLRLPF